MSTDAPYAGGRWTAARYRQFVVSALRRAWMKYPVKQDVLAESRRPAQGRSKQTKWEYRCASCGGWFLGSEVQVDHIRECKSDDMNEFVATLFCEADNLQVVCKGCHQIKTREARKRKLEAAQAESDE